MFCHLPKTVIGTQLFEVYSHSNRVVLINPYEPAQKVSAFHV